MPNKQKTDYIRNLHIGMHSRCYSRRSPHYKNYGGRGIKVCREWKHIKDFRKWILDNIGERPSPQHSIDRIDNNGNYEPGNVRWATKKQQANNRRPVAEHNRPKHINYTPHYRRFVEYEGIVLPEAVCARIIGVTKSAIYYMRRSKHPNKYGIKFVD